MKKYVLWLVPIGMIAIATIVILIFKNNKSYQEFVNNNSFEYDEEVDMNAYTEYKDFVVYRVSDDNALKLVEAYFSNKGIKGVITEIPLEEHDFSDPDNLVNYSNFVYDYVNIVDKYYQVDDLDTYESYEVILIDNQIICEKIVYD